ncbi:divergent PAP2 family protein [Candidatus Woesearchaeota archaeon]|nr:divergent PAP2 family protein [Candidatus Woesearchaeota archaeon]
MSVLIQILSNKILQAGVLSWLAAQIIKLVILAVKNKKLDFSILLKTGNMPSSHTATIVGVASAVYLLEGLSNLFFVSAFVAGIIMYDSVTLRKQVGIHSKIINKLSKTKIREYLGHTGLEVLIGAVVGIVVASLLI